MTPPASAAVPGSTISASLPLVSVVVPVFNAGPYLAQSLDSVLSQDYPHIELIAVDDGSTDDSAAVLASYGGRIKVLRGTRSGPAAARNRGVAAAGGQLIAFQDADDVWLPGKLRQQVEHLLAHPEHAIAFSQFAFWNALPDGSFPDPASLIARPECWEVKQPLSGWIYVDLLSESCIGMNTPLLRREVFECVGGFDETLLAGSDYDFWLKATYRFQAHKIAKCLALYRIHQAGVTGTPKDENYAARLYQRALDRQGVVGPDGRSATPEQVARRMSSFWIVFGLQHLERGDLRRGVTSLSRYIACSPTKLSALRSSISAGLRAVMRRLYGSRLTA